MKKFLTLCLLICFAVLSRSQAVLNEVYPQPGNGYHEFFELYNENNSVEYLDNYTIVTYYEESTKSGFYVLDMPNDSMIAHGFYVGASQTPFDIQLQPGLIADFNWNAMPAGGSLTKWERNGSTYTSVSVPVNLNDFIVRITGGGDGVYHVFVYKNGILVNGVVGGINTTTLPPNIKTMPSLPIDMSGASPDFTINFSSIPDKSIEFIPNSLGTNNGYFRESDGLCGEWLKSDAPGQHNPGSTNGGSSSSSTAQVAIAAVISQYEMDPTKSLLTYNITAAPAGAFPIVVTVYNDLGIATQWDINDVLIDTRNIFNAAAGPQYVVLPSWDIAVIIVVESASDCYDTTLAIPNFWSVLPATLINFQGNINKNNRVTLEWKIADNETVNYFEVERSFDGREFKTAGLVFTSEKNGTENYMFYETINPFDKVMYRLKINGKANNATYSKTLIFQSKPTTRNSIRIIGNPVNEKLVFSYASLSSGHIDVKVYDMNGRMMMNNKMKSLEGNNTYSVALNTSLKPNMYVVEVNNGTDTQSAKFLRQ